MNDLDDTIAAISTPTGSGGISVIRISGPEAILVAERVYRGKTRLTEAESHHVYFGKVIDVARSGQAETSGEDGSVLVLDEAVVTVFKRPHSYTREDVVEISCHGGQFLSHRILQLILARGARLAQPGEFTQRAFMNGRFDLSQAEAVADLIQAKTELSLRAAVNQFQGALSNRIQKMREDLIDICSLLELELDFAEEDVRFADRSEVHQSLDTIMADIEDFAATYRRGKIVREGVRLVIVGKPNVGKSSLLNALLKEERAIVTEIPGTTRDVLEEQVDIRGVYFRIVDTAGVRHSQDRVEQEGVRRTMQQIREADLILFLFDGSERFDDKDREVVAKVLALRKERENGIIVAINKMDLKARLTREELAGDLESHPIVEISAKEHTGLQGLEEVLVRHALGHDFSENMVLVTTIRQKEALKSAHASLKSALASLRQGLSSEFVALDIRTAMDSLGEIIGVVSTEDILGNIFSKFCIGK